MTNGSWANVPVGTIVDSDMTSLAASNELITAQFDPNCVRQACYELRASDVFFDPALPEESRRSIVAADDGFVLRPHRAVVAIVKEELRLPADVLGRVMTKGRLFSIGILPVNTYADPGFEGRLGITLVNSGERYVCIRPGDHIAKIEFTRLPKAVAHPYAGQHGYATGIWPIPTTYFVDPAALRRQHGLGTDQEEFERSYGPRLGELRASVDRYARLVWIQLAMVLVAFMGLYALYGQFSLFWSVTLGVAANLVTFVLFPLVQRAAARGRS